MLVLPLAAMAQEDEVDYVSDDAARTTGAVWTEVGVTKLLPYDLSIGVDAGFRTDDWFNEASRADIGVGLNWKPNKHWKVGVGYTFLMKYYRTETERKTTQETEWLYRNRTTGEFVEYTSFQGAPQYQDEDGVKYKYQGYDYKIKDYKRVTDPYWRPKHRISVDAAYTTSRLWGWLRVSVRERYQVTFIPSKYVTRLRTRVKTTTQYRDPATDEETGDLIYDDNGQLVYNEVTRKWQEGNQVFSEVTDEDGVVTTTSEDVTDENAMITYEQRDKTKSNKTLHTLRSRLTLELDRKGWKWTPYVYAEVFNDLTRRMKLDKLRLSAGVEYAVAKQHKIGLGYVFNRENDDDGKQTIHAISASYKFKF